MAKNANLKNSVAQVVKTNGAKGITGANLQPTILQVIDKLGGGYQFGGLVQPNGTFPVDVNGNSLTDQNFAFLASTPGTYTNFGGLVVNEGEVCVFLWDGTWTKQVTGIITGSKMAEDYAKKVGSYAGLTAGISCGIADSISNGTPQQFTFRQSGGDGVNYMKRIKGKTMVWNQLVGAGDTEVTVPSGHVYVSVIGGTKARATSDGTPVAVTGGTDVIFDLALMFGAGNEPSTVAEFEALYPLPYYDYNAGAKTSNDAMQVKTTGFNQWDEQWENGAISNDGSEVASNDYWRAKNLIPVIAGQEYYFKSNRRTQIWVVLYNSNGDFISRQQINDGAYATFTFQSGVNYIRVFMGGSGVYKAPNNDICINLSDPAKNGTYEPYWERTIQLNLTTRQDTDGNIPFPNGMQSCPVAYDEADELGGTVRVGTRAYEVGDEENANFTTDGTTTNYALAEPVPFTWAEPLPNAILVDALGTEEAVFPEHLDGTPSAPFCCDSNYSISVKNLVAALAALNANLGGGGE